MQLILLSDNALAFSI